MATATLDWENHFAEGEAVGTVHVTAATFSADVAFSIDSAFDPGPDNGELSRGFPFLQMNLSPGPPATDPLVVASLAFTPVAAHVRAEALHFNI